MKETQRASSLVMDKLWTLEKKEGKMVLTYLKWKNIPREANKDMSDSP